MAGYNGSDAHAGAHAGADLGTAGHGHGFSEELPSEGALERGRRSGR